MNERIREEAEKNIQQNPITQTFYEVSWTIYRDDIGRMDVVLSTVNEPNILLRKLHNQGGVAERDATLEEDIFLEAAMMHHIPESEPLTTVKSVIETRIKQQREELEALERLRVQLRGGNPNYLQANHHTD